MNPSQAFKSVLFNYFNFSDRAQRSEYWWWSLAMFTLSIVVEIVETATLGIEFGRYGPISALMTLIFFIPGIAVQVRRLHDVNWSGWWALLWIVPVVGWVPLIVLSCLDSTPGPNKYGQNPKGVESEYPVTANT